MYELIQVGEHSYYMDCPSKVGFYVTNDDAYLIDAGSDKDAGKKVKKILDAQGWNLKAIYNTHSHADHIGGNAYLQAQTGCKIYLPQIESSFANNTVLEPMMLYGGCPLPEMNNKFLRAKESDVSILEDELPKGMELISLPGHCFDMVGYKTCDDVAFIADALSSRETLDKYKIGFVYDVGAYIETLKKIKEMKASCFVPSHAEAADSISELAQINIDNTYDIIETIIGILNDADKMTFEDILAALFDKYELAMNLTQRMLVGSSVLSYLSYLAGQGRVSYIFENNRMYWRID